MADTPVGLWESKRRERVDAQKAVMQALSSGQGIPLQSGWSGSNLGIGHGVVLNGRQAVVVKDGWKNFGTGQGTSYSAAREGINIGGETLFPIQSGPDVFYVSRSGSSPTEIEKRYGISASQNVDPVDPAARNVPQVTPGDLARKSEADRMMQQYASDEYWDTEAGKAMMELGSQESYEGDNLAEFYNAQQAVGTGTLDEIIDAMGYTGNMEIWAKANPALALREYQKNSEALPTEGYAGYGTGELKVDERLKDVTNQFLQQQVDQLKDREDGPLWGPGPGDPPPVVQTQEQAPNLPGFPLPSQADGLSELLQSLGTREILDQIDETGGGLAEQAGEWYGREKAKQMPGADWPVIGDLIQNEGAKRGGAKGREYWNQYTGPLLQPN